MKFRHAIAYAERPYITWQKTNLKYRCCAESKSMSGRKTDGDRNPLNLPLIGIKVQFAAKHADSLSLEK